MKKKNINFGGGECEFDDGVRAWIEIFSSNEQVETKRGLVGHHWTSKTQFCATSRSPKTSPVWGFQQIVLLS